MTLQNQTLVDRILSALRELREAETEMLGLLEELLSENQNDYPDSVIYGGTTSDGIQFTYTGDESGQGDDLPRPTRQPCQCSYHNYFTERLEGPSG